MNQLSKYMSGCSQITINNIKDCNYVKKDLVKLFTKYANCNGNSTSISFKEKQKKDFFNLTLRLGLNNSSLSIDNSNSDSRDVKFDNELSFRLGIEAEFILPFHKNKWGVLLEPSYQSYKSEKMLTNGNAIVDYKSIELGVGGRHYFFLNKNSKIFFNSLYIFDLTLDSKIDFDSGSNLKIKSFGNIVFGLGYKFKNRYSLEFRIGSNRNITNNLISWSSEYKTSSLIFGYTLL